ncbi:MAG: FAD-dependent oxidoreductase, partial [Desulfomonilia bacterium]|nr:FAD-dependent oxidoreductase [Desulfomonilia bacterium]
FAMAQGKIYVSGDIGARGMTMTKANPRFDAPELWVLGGVGDSFGEFMAGGTAVICGIGSHYRKSLLGHRPCVGMVGGRIYFRGTQKNFSEADAKLVRIVDEEWEWLTGNLTTFLEAIDRTDLFEILTSDRSQWSLLVALQPYEKTLRTSMTMDRFRAEVWEKELGSGGLIGDISTIDRSPIPLVCTGELRRFIPVWENHKYRPPCQAACPTGIPVQKRWELIRSGQIEEAVNLSLHYTPFPATVCGYLCPHLCMEQCTRGAVSLDPVDVSVLGKASIDAREPVREALTGKKVAIIGGGPAGLSVAWQLWIKGHEPVIFDRAPHLGGKIRSVIPHSRIPSDVFQKEIERLSEKLTHEQISGETLTESEFMDIRDRYEFTVIAVGAQNPRKLEIKGNERAVTATEFLRFSKTDAIKVGKRVVIIGAGNVGCDVATEAHRHGARNITLIDIQKPASYGTEREAAEAIGARFLWPVRTQEITKKGVELTDGRFLPASLVVIAIGDQPDLRFLPPDIDTDRGYIKVNEQYQTTDGKVFAIGDTVRLGLLTDAIGAGRT